MTAKGGGSWTGDLTCLPILEGRIDFHPFQLDAAAKVLVEMGGNAILADEVGLGKTVEAGIVVKELVYRGKAENILVLVPKALERQWQMELMKKFDEAFLRVEEVGRPRLEDPSLPLRLIACHASMSRQDSFNRLAARTWDIVVVDEAHRFSNPNANMTRNLKSLRRKRTLLLTATPLQNSLREIFQLMEIVTPELVRESLFTWKDYSMDERGRLLRASQAESLRSLLRKVLIRRRRADVGIPFPPRVVESKTVVPVGPEQELIASVHELFGRMSALAPSSAGIGFMRVSLLQAVSSHPIALERSLANLRFNDSSLRATAEHMRRKAQDVHSSAKDRALHAFLEYHEGEQAVIFTERLATGFHLAETLGGRLGPAAFYRGDLSSSERQAIVEGFRRGNILYFISTSAGAEGLNLQNAALVINFDLHWNPLRLEQRIGRVHRFGQKRIVTVLNLLTRGTIDELVKTAILDKLDLFRLVLGEVGTVLSHSGPDIDLEYDIRRALQGSKDIEEAAERVKALGRKVERLRVEHLGSRTATQEFLDTVLA